MRWALYFCFFIITINFYLEKNCYNKSMALSFPNLDGSTDVDGFIKAYRDSLVKQYDANRAFVDNARDLQEANIMANANARGMMYSNFPQRDKLKYQTSTYMPGIVSARNTYQTGIDKLRSNAVSVANDIKSIEQAIADLNKYGTSGYNPAVQ